MQSQLPLRSAFSSLPSATLLLFLVSLSDRNEHTNDRTPRIVLDNFQSVESSPYVLDLAFRCPFSSYRHQCYPTPHLIITSLLITWYPSPSPSLSWFKPALDVVVIPYMGLPHCMQLSLNSSFALPDIKVCTQISTYLAGVSSWMAAYQLEFNPSKTIYCCSATMN